MNKIDYINILLEKDNLTDYIAKIENNTSIYPPEDLKQRILSTCYINNVTKKCTTRLNKKYKFTDIIKVACFTLIIAICTEAIIHADLNSSNTNEFKSTAEKIINTITFKLDELTKKFSNYMLDFDLKGEK